MPAATVERALGHVQSGQWLHASRECQQLLRRDERQPLVWRLAGIAAWRQGRAEEAIRSLTLAIELAPGFCDTYLDLTAMLHEMGHFPAAEHTARAALQLDSCAARGHFLLGAALQSQDELDQAITAYQRALELQPVLAEAAVNLAGLYNGAGRFDEARAAARTAIAARPESVAAWIQLGNSLAGHRRFAEAIAAFREALRIDPRSATAAYNCGATLEQAAAWDEALSAYQLARTLDPRMPEAANNAGVVLRTLGHVDDALRAFQTALALQPHLTAAQSNALLTLHYRPGITRRELFEKHAAWGRRLSAATVIETDPDPGRRLRLGFVSADLGQHPVGHFLAHLLEGFDPDEFSTVCFDDGRRNDPVSQRIRRAVGAWHDTGRHSDGLLWQTIRGEQIDLLFDLSGHTGRNRLGVFARRAAPVQLSWIGYVGTTGVPAMDCLIADGFHVPEGTEADHVERVLRLPGDYVCFEPPEDAPPVGPLPALRNGHVTFGSFNNPAKLNAAVIDVWAKVLTSIPASRLLLKYQGWESPQARQRVLDLFAAHAIPENRIEFRGSSPRPEVLAQYADVDIALDTFPYSGGLTTCEALWMGVPVVTMPGETFASRHSFSHLSNAGQPDLIAQDRESYVRLAVALAADPAALAARRGPLRESVGRSRLCDRVGFIRDWSQALRDLWRSHLGERGA